MALPFPNIDPVAFSLGPFSIRWYALAYMAGIMLGWKYALMWAGKYEAAGLRPVRDDIDDFLTWAVLGIILGGRLGYVLFYNLPYYLDNPAAILHVWEGGMAFHGGALGVILAIILFARHKKFSILRLGDVVCSCVPIGLFFGRLANFINGELFGRVTDSALGMVFPRGGPEPRHPSQLYEAGLEGLVLFGIIYATMRWQSTQDRPGVTAGAFLLGYGIFRAFIEFFREPDTQIGLIGNAISMGQILCLPMIFVGGAMIIYALRVHPKTA